jgi:hypothetical protein
MFEITASLRIVRVAASLVANQIFNHDFSPYRSTQTPFWVRNQQYRWPFWEPVVQVPEFAPRRHRHQQKAREYADILSLR